VAALPVPGLFPLSCAQASDRAFVRVPKGVSELEYHDTIQDPKTGGPITRKLTISAPGAYGLPTVKDDEVILGLIQGSLLGSSIVR
jgi:hypothetical protein